MRLLTLLLLVWSLLSPACANDTETGLEAGLPYPLKSASLRLVNEDLTVTLDPQYATVDVTFKLRNEGPARDVLLGFPYFSNVDRLYTDQNYAGDVLDFECTVDGQPVAVSKSRGKPISKAFKSTSWFTWKVPFAAGETRVVAHRFRGRLGTSVAAELPAGEAKFVSFFDYILTTAKNWKKPVDRFRLTIRPVGPVKISDIYGVSLENVKVDGKVLTVTRTAYMPDRDLRIYLYANFSRSPMEAGKDWINPAFELRKGNRPLTMYPLDTPLAQKLRDAVVARFGPKNMQRYNIVAYKDTWFAATNKYDSAGTQVAVWEHVNGRWQYVFDYNDRKMSEKQLDALYARYRFSPAMRRQLTESYFEDYP